MQKEVVGQVSTVRKLRSIAHSARANVQFFNAEPEDFVLLQKRVPGGQNIAF